MEAYDLSLCLALSLAGLLYWCLTEARNLRKPYHKTPAADSKADAVWDLSSPGKAQPKPQRPRR